MKAPMVDVLCSPLRADAGAPEFSPLLHERVMATLRARALEPLPPEKPVRSRWRLALEIAIPTAIAATVAMAAWMSFPQPVTQPQDSHPGLVVIGPMPAVDPTVVLEPIVKEALVERADLALDTGKYASLDKDAERLAVFVADQLPSFNVPETHP